MVKSLVSIISVIIILLCGAFYENDFVTRQFEEFNSVMNVLYEKTENKTATEEDVKAVRENWAEKKRYLHIFIPHNEIKEIDLWISEMVTLVNDEKWEDAVSKAQVLLYLSTEIPKTFLFRRENIL